MKWTLPRLPVVSVLYPKANSTESKQVRLDTTLSLSSIVDKSTKLKISMCVHIRLSSLAVKARVVICSVVISYQFDKNI